MAGRGRPSIEPAFLEAIARGVKWPEGTWAGNASVNAEFLADLSRLASRAPKALREEFLAAHVRRRKPAPKVDDGLDIDDL